ncbi:NTAN1 [Mytilus edulis]|uniref:NTAN1 n=1 Tax=Mytilus edulis TaxID=6550 RepID=A0A8S3QZB8_MYTED|nr:NTAN1 [Mytilus edulis]
MPLMIEGKPIGGVPKTVQEFLEKYDFKDSSNKLKSATSPEDEKILVMGSEDATTCHIVIIRHTGCGAVCIAHFDGYGSDKAVKDIMRVMNDLCKNKPFGRYELHVAGGFKDDDESSEKVSIKTLNAFNSTSEEIHLMTACICGRFKQRGKERREFPVIYGLAVNVKTGDVYRGTFLDHGPDMPLRSARHFTGTEEVINVYDHRKSQIRLDPITYSTMDEIELLCRMPDLFIRQHLSTSPDQEPPHFEASVRAALVQIRDYPDPKKSMFADGKPRCYNLESNGSWTKV